MFLFKLLVGWGKTHYGRPDVLQQALLPIQSPGECEKKYPGTYKFAHLCAGEGRAGASGGCFGDSGGPLVCEMRGRWYLHGAVSFGAGDCRTTYCTVFARITSYKPWILQKIGWFIKADTWSSLKGFSHLNLFLDFRINQSGLFNDKSEFVHCSTRRSPLFEATKFCIIYFIPLSTCFQLSSTDSYLIAVSCVQQEVEAEDLTKPHPHPHKHRGHLNHLVNYTASALVFAICCWY